MLKTLVLHPSTEAQFFKKRRNEISKDLSDLSTKEAKQSTGKGGAQKPGR